MVTQAAAVAVTAALAGLTSQGLAPAPVVIGLALILGLTTAFAIPAMQALVPLLVPRDQLGPAVALNSLTFNLARAIGPVAGAFVVAGPGYHQRCCPQLEVADSQRDRVMALWSLAFLGTRPFGSLADGAVA